MTSPFSPLWVFFTHRGQQKIIDFLLAVEGVATLKHLQRRKAGYMFVMLAFFAISTKAQVNYVQNPSFEQYDTCPDWIGQIQYAHYWSNLINGLGGSPDFMHSCANPNLYVGVPNNDNGMSHQYPKSGLGYARIWLLQETNLNPNSFNAEYMNNKLAAALIKDKSYCVKAHLSFCEGGFNCFTDGFGFYFDNGTYLPSMNVTAQVENPSFNYLTDSVGWMEVSGTFIATGDEEYINLGNFRKLQSNYIPTANDPQNGYYASAYYIDDVSVIESDLPAFAGNDTALLNPGDSLYLGRPTEIGLACVWYNWAGDSIGTGAGIWITPQHTAPYIVEQNLCGNIKRDTVYVSVGTGIENASVFEGLKVFPNPSQGQFTLWSKNFQSLSTIAISISELSGKVVYGELVATQAERVIDTKLPSGMYFLQVREIATGKMAVRRLVIR